MRALPKQPPSRQPSGHSRLAVADPLALGLRSQPQLASSGEVDSGLPAHVANQRER
jgi:hypothetical protein